MLSSWGRPVAEKGSLKSPRFADVYILGSQVLLSVYMVAGIGTYVPNRHCYPQKEAFIHSYEAFFHSCLRQIWACQSSHPPYLGLASFHLRSVIHKRSRLSTVIPHFSTDYVMKTQLT
jgi:hypothetical protein